MKTRQFICESCEEEYEIVWDNEHDPEYCPFCGDMNEDWEDEEEDDDEDEEWEYLTDE
jgi:rubrerythrin